MTRYTDEQRAFVINRIKSEVKDCLGLYGVRKTAVDELVKRVNIPKGTFYLFFPSKEELLYQVICEYILDLQQRFYKQLDNTNKLTQDEFTKIAYILMKEVNNSFLVQVAKNNEREFLISRLPEKVTSNYEIQIAKFNEKLMNYLPINDKQQLQTILSSFEIIFYSSLNKNSIGDDFYYASLHLLLSGFSRELLSTGG